MARLQVVEPATTVRTHGALQFTQVSHPIALPEDLRIDFRAASGVIHALSEEFHLQRLPSTWDLAQDFNDDSKIYLVAIKRSFFNLRVYDVKSRKFRSIQARFTTTIGHLPLSTNGTVFKAPPGHWCSSPVAEAAATRSMQSLDISTLVAPDRQLDVAGLFPLGLLDEVHLIFNPPTNEVLEELDVPGPLGTNYVRQERDEFFRKAPKKSPSSEARGANLHSSPRNQQLLGRRDHKAAPPSLFDETLCEFRHNVLTMDPSNDDEIHFETLRNKMIQAYQDESERQREFNKVIGNILKTTPQPHFISSFHTDGTIYTEIAGLMLIYLIAEIKNEIGTTDAEPGLQAALYYLEHVRRYYAADEGKLDHCAFPVILLCQFGPFLSVLVAASGGSPAVPSVEQITCIPLHVHSTNLEILKAGARVIGALRIAHEAFPVRYPKLVQKVDPQYEVRFPFRRHVRSQDAITHFRYTRAEPDKRVYFGHTKSDGHPLCIKFSRRYSAEAHSVAIQEGIAPSLIAVEEVYGWFLVVMHDVSASYVTLSELKTRDGVEQRMESIKIAVRKALDSLHAHGYVHGDIRDVNVLVHEPNLGPIGAESILLVDWDWAGKDGHATYPITLNTEIPRSAGARPGRPITRLHDLDMVDRLHLDSF
ncbi:hypothetical protein HGRIS_004225 [Hohenbuehelia grisea]|uniref:Protein kinase domain-containing protein n=4 Tax=Hohenbuehelia grisea TaxID=104357 RepID=A0ABR3IP54_9AGAR